MDLNIDRSTLERLIKEIITEKLSSCNALNTCSQRQVSPSGVISVKIPTIKVAESDRLDTGKPNDVVYTKDVFSLQESPRLGCGIMEMDHTTFDWTLNYDEIDYVIEGSLSIISNGHTVTANAGELVLIPKGSSIQFSVPNYARFIYVTYPADWSNS